MDLERRIHSLREIKKIPQNAARLGLVLILATGSYIALEGAKSVSAKGPGSPTALPGFTPNPDNTPLATAVRAAIITATVIPTGTATSTSTVTATATPTKTVTVRPESPTAVKSPSPAASPAKPSVVVEVTKVAGSSENGQVTITLQNNINITQPAIPTQNPDEMTLSGKTFNDFIEKGIKLKEDARKEFITPSPTVAPARTAVPAAANGGRGWSFDVWSALIGAVAGAGLIELGRYARRRVHLPHHHPHEHPAPPAPPAP